MDISYNWLKRYIDFDCRPKELAAIFTSLGLECDTVEEVESIRGGLRGVVIGKVLTCVEHPNSDHLHITTVDLGQGEPVQIVCGAPNVAAGQTVVVATVGTTLYDGDNEFQIKKSKIRGVESLGMICAEDEIGVGKSHDGIMVLEQEVAPGTPAAAYFNLESDWRLEVELTPNRVDAASHYGTARDLRAYMARHNADGTIPEIHTPDVNAFESDRKDGAATAEVVDHQGAPRYSGVTVRGVKVGESPKWLRELLVAAGQRPINNIVDITNFILLGMGQPLHCFDLGKVAGEKIVVRTCPAGTKFTTLDGVEHTLHESDLMICDAEKPMCIAGVFGGLDSGVTEATTDVFIESAWFNPSRVRKTARRHGLSTDSSFRYERGTDPLITVYAAKLAALLVKELAGGEICGDVIDIYPTPAERAECMLGIDYTRNLIGKDIPLETIKTILKALEIDILPDSTEKELHLRIPPYRVDVTRPCDVVEEILRVYGYDNISASANRNTELLKEEEPLDNGRRNGTSLGDTDLSFKLRNIISEQLTAQGFNEIMNNSLSAESYYRDSTDLPLEKMVKVMNPLSSDLGVMRGTLLYGGLESIAHNANRKASDLRFYEFGNVYALTGNSDDKPLTPYHEEEMLALWMTGNMQLPSWNAKAAEVTFYDLRAVVDNILLRLGIPAASLLASQESDEFFAAKLVLTSRNGQKFAEIGILRKQLLKKMDIHQNVVYAQIWWKPVFKAAKKAKVNFAMLPKTQPVKRDLSLLLDKNISLDAVKAVVEKSERKLLRDFTLFDVYEGDKLPEGKKSYAISMTLQDNEKTLNDKQIDAVMNKIIANLKNQLGAELR